MVPTVGGSPVSCWVPFAGSLYLGKLREWLKRSSLNSSFHGEWAGARVPAYPRGLITADSSVFCKNQKRSISVFPERSMHGTDAELLSIDSLENGRAEDLSSVW